MAITSKTDLLYDSIKRLQRRDAKAHIRKMLLKAHPSEVAAVIRQLSDDEAVELISLIRNSSVEVDVFSELGSGFLETYLDLNDSDKEHIAHVIQKIDHDDAAAILDEIDTDLADELMGLMKEAKKNELSEILDYEEDSCGRIMNKSVFFMNQDSTAKEAIESLQKTAASSVFYIYVVDDFKNLIGVCSLRQVLQVPQDKTLKTFMERNVKHVNVHQTQEEAALSIEEYNFVSFPVTNDQGQLLGVITVDDIIDYIRDEAQDEVLQLTGVESEGVEDFGFVRAFLSRGMWYGLLLLGGILCSEIILHFFNGFPRQILYVCFAPLVLRFGGSVSMQTSTFVNQSILDEGIEKERASRALWGQNLVILVVALLMGGIVFAYGYFRFEQNFVFPLSISVAMLTVTVFALMMGVLVPVIFHKLGMDALQSSSRFIHFLMDALSLLVFFEVIWIWYSYV